MYRKSLTLSQLEVLSSVTKAQPLAIKKLLLKPVCSRNLTHLTLDALEIFSRPKDTPSSILKGIPLFV